MLKPNAHKLKFRTKIKIPVSERKINHNDPVLLLGSCFSDQIGQRFLENKFKGLVNPFGVIFNPHSIFLLIETVLDGVSEISENEIRPGFVPEVWEKFAQNLIFNEGLWHHLHLHSDFSHPDRDTTYCQILSVLAKTADFLKHTDTLILTFGTAFAWRYLPAKEIVANCHKIPSENFQPFLIPLAAITGHGKKLIDKMLALKPGLRLILTVSPVRHTRSGLIENGLGKAILRVACQELVEASLSVEYFPAYEIMVDDLRDYRFYEEDLVHPSDFSEKYIWEKVGETFFSKKTLETNQKWIKIKAGLNHKAFHPNTEAHQTFLKNLLLELEEINKELDCMQELQDINSRIKPSSPT